MSDSKLNFTVDARLITQLGEQLVPSDIAALAELVKNAYDADATSVLIDYYPEAELPYLVIEDDGNGMTLDDLRRGWMTVGTAMKELNDTSPKFGRIRAGRKGVGRFAAQRLGHDLTLWSKVGGATRALEVNFRWDDFKAGLPLETVYQTATHVHATKTEKGTRLTIRELSRTWTKEDLSSLLKELLLLSPPASPQTLKAARTSSKLTKGTEPDPGFALAASFHGTRLIETVDELTLLREERVMSVEVTVDKKGAANCKLEFVRPNQKPQVEKLDRVYCTGPLRIYIDLFLLDRDNLGALGVRKAQLLARRYGGIRIWRDGFRILPFGDPDNDWLGLDAHAGARRPPLNMWRNQTVLGGAYITRKDNPELIELINRRGLLENAAYKDLKELVFECLKIAAFEHDSLKDKEKHRHSRDEQPKPSELLQRKLQEERERREREQREQGDALRQAESQSRIDATERARLENDARRAENEARLAEEQMVADVKASEDELLGQIAMLRVLASLGTGLATFSHELRTIMKPIGLATQQLERISGESANQLPLEPRSRLKKAIAEISSGITIVSVYRRYIDDFIQEGSLRRKSSIELGPYLKELTNIFQSLFDRRRIDVTISTVRGIWSKPLHRAQLNSIIFNLLTNAVKALMAPGITDRRILFALTEHQDQAQIIVADSGCGVPSAIKNRIFDPFVSRSHTVDDDELGTGTGLGLTVAKDVANEIGATFHITNAPETYTTAFELRIPLSLED